MKTVVSLNLIVEAVCATFDVAPTELRSFRRNFPIVRARDAACLIAKDLTDFTLSTISAALGGRDHSTAVAALIRASERYDSDVEYRRQVDTARVAALAIARSSIGRLFVGIDAMSTAERLCADPDRAVMQVATCEILAIADRLLEMGEAAAGAAQLVANIGEFMALPPNEPECQAHRAFLARRIRALTNTLASALTALGYAEPQQLENK